MQIKSYISQKNKIYISQYCLAYQPKVVSRGEGSFLVGLGFGPGLGKKLTKISGLIRA